MAISHVSLGPIERYLQILWERNGSDLLLTCRCAVAVYYENSRAGHVAAFIGIR